MGIGVLGGDSENSPGGESATSRRLRAQTLVVADGGDMVSNLRSVLSTLGYSKISIAGSVPQAIDRLRERRFDLVFFDARKGQGTNPYDLIKHIKNINQDELAIAVSSNPEIDEVFELLKAGARGFIVTPFTPSIVDDVIDKAFVGPPFSETMLQAPDRNAALAACMLNNLDRLASIKYYARKYNSANREVYRYQGELHSSADLAYMFCEAHDRNRLRDAIVDMCIRRADGPASRLGRVRAKLQKEKSPSALKGATAQ